MSERAGWVHQGESRINALAIPIEPTKLIAANPRLYHRVHATAPRIPPPPWEDPRKSVTPQTAFRTGPEGSPWPSGLFYVRVFTILNASATLTALA